MKQREAAISELWRQYRHRNVHRAVEISTIINQQYPDWARGWAETSRLALKLENVRISIRAAEEALSLEPENLEWLLLLLYALLKLGKLSKVRKLLRGIDPNEIKLMSQCQEIGNLQVQQGLHVEALRTFETALEKFPANHNGCFNLAVVQRYLGKLDEAEDSFTKAIEMNPNDGEAYWLRSTLRRQTASDNHITDLERKASVVADLPEVSAAVNYALAKELEDLGEYDQSFDVLQVATAMKRSTFQYDVSRDRALIASIQSVFDCRLLEDCSYDDDHDISHTHSEAAEEFHDPIFIVGFPRSGSTLVERILCQSERVESLGESTLFAEEFMQQAYGDRAESKQNIEYSADVIKSIDFQNLADSYLKKANLLCTTNGHVLNKLPLNAIHVGLICLAFNGARIIWTRRHPLDQCYAMYKNLFGKGYPFSYEFEELATYYVSLYRLMEHWCQLFPNNIHILDYEKLVDDSESVVQDLYHFCGLPWSPSSLEFYKDNSASTTASATQVRNPIYKSSVLSWRRYRKQLSPLIMSLESAGINCT